MSENQMANITTEVNEARLSTLAAEINTIKRQTQKIMMEAAVEIGRRLVEAKGAVGHGNWGAWLESNVDYSERTAQNLIRIFQEYGEGQQSLFGPENPQSLADLDLTYTQAVALLGIKNPDERMEFIETHDVQNMTSRELADAIKERDDAYKTMDEEKEKRRKAEKERDEAEKQRQEIANAKIEQESALMKELDDLRAQVARMAKESAKEQNADPGKAAFSAYFNLSKNAFNGMLEAVGKIEDDQEKYRTAMVKMLEVMIDTVKG